MLSGCRKDVSEQLVIIEEAPPVVYIESAIRGKVVNEFDQPVQGALVKVENEYLISDTKGNFHFKKVEVKKSGTIISAAVDGYFTGVVHSGFTAEGSSFVQINLTSKGNPNQIQSESGGSFTTSDNLNVKIPANAFTYSSGLAYNGPVNVYSKWFDPTLSKTVKDMPGRLAITTENGELETLNSFGMFTIDFQTSNGDELLLKPETETEVSFEIPEELLNKAPDEIPIWYFDLEEEQWVINGYCNKDGNTYKCNTSCSGTWSCSQPVPAICLSGQVFNSDSTYAPYLQVLVEDLTDNFLYWGFTDSIGYFCGAVPQAAPLLISIIDNCDNTVYSAEVGPYSDDFILTDIYLEEVVEQFFIDVTGTVSHCLTNDIPDGHVAISYPGQIRVFPFAGGGFDFSMALTCVEFPDIEVKVYSSSQKYASESINYSEFSAFDLGEQITCDTLSDYFNLVVDGVEFWTAPTQFYFLENATTNWLVLEGMSGSGQFTLEVRDYSGPGSYSSDVFLKTTNETPAPLFPTLNSSSPDISLDILEVDGLFIIGNIEGTANDNNGNTLFISGNFKIKRAP